MRLPNIVLVLSIMIVNQTTADGELGGWAAAVLGNALDTDHTQSQAF